MSDWDKPFKTYDELISLMRSRNIIITDDNYAKECLSDISYYLLVNGHKDLFPSVEERFIVPVPLETLHYLYLIDTRLNNILFRYIIEIERSLKSKISYVVSKNYGVYTDIYDLSNSNPSDYLYRDNFKNIHMRNNILHRIKKEIIQKKREPDISHYISSHNHLPCWILINNIPFGLTIKLLQIMKSDDKTYVCDSIVHSNIELNQRKSFLSISLIILKEYRNKIAHGKKIFTNTINREIPKNIVLHISNGQITNEDYINGIGKNDLFAVILIIMNLTRGICKEQFLAELIDFFTPLKNIPLNGRGLFDLLSLPNDFLERLNNMN